MEPYGKRHATSPVENMAKKEKAKALGPIFEADQETIVRIELETINGKPFLGQTTDDEILYIWVRVFNRQKDELYGISSTKTLTRNVRATFKLKKPIKLTDLYASGSFSYEKFVDENNKDVITGRIVGYGAMKPAEIGDLVKVTVRLGWVEPAGVLQWMKQFGIIASKTSDYQTNPATGLKTDVFETELVLKHHISEYLPIYGQKAQVFYPGIPRVCNRCYKAGHLRRDCQNTKKDWVQYIVELLDNGLSPELIGSWSKAVNLWREANKK
jgi:hypothetical protein